MADLKFSNITRPTSAPAVGGGFMGSPLNVNVTNEPAPSADLSAPEAVGGWADIAKKADKSRKWAKAEKIVNSVLSGLGALANLGAGAMSMVSKGKYPFIPIGNAFAAGGDVFGDLSKNNINNFNEYNAAMGLQSEGVSPQEAAQMANAGVAANVLQKKLTEKDSNPTEWSLALKAAGGDPMKALQLVQQMRERAAAAGRSSGSGDVKLTTLLGLQARRDKLIQDANELRAGRGVNNNPLVTDNAFNQDSANTLADQYEQAAKGLDAQIETIAPTKFGGAGDATGVVKKGTSKNAVKTWDPSTQTFK